MQSPGVQDRYGDRMRGCRVHLVLIFLRKSNHTPFLEENER